MDRSTKATLNTYNTWIQLSRLQKVYHFPSVKLKFTEYLLTETSVDLQQGRSLMFVR